MFQHARAPLAVLFATAACGLVATGIPRGVAAADFYVSPTGSDQNAGTAAQKPLATLEAALAKVAELRRKEPGRDRPVEINLAGGTYFLEKPIEMGPEHSGTQKSPTIITAAGDQRPVLSGGRRLSDWKVVAQGRWEAKVPGEPWYFARLFVDDQARPRPRLPKKGYHHIAEKLEPTEKSSKKGWDRFGYANDDIRADWTQRDAIEVMAFHQWSASRLHIAEIDTEKRHVTFTGHTRSKAEWTSMPKGGRYIVYNVREALSEPGEWYLDQAAGTVTYLPKPGETPDKTQVIAPKLENLLVIKGDPAAKKPVEYVHFRGLTFAHANWRMPAQGQSYPQAEVNLDSAIIAIAARHLKFDICCVRHVDQYAVALGEGCRENRIENCELVDLGGGGIKIGHALRGGPALNQAGDADDRLASHNTVHNCLIAHGGRLHPAAVGIWIGQSPHNKLTHNHIHDLYYTGISIGWTWGYGPAHAHHNEVGFNLVHDIGRGVLSDMGGIYTLGKQPGTVVHDNVFHDIQSLSYGGWGLYTDEGSSDIVMENNLVYRTKTGGFHQHYGRENIIRNNIFAFAKEQQLQRTRTEPHSSFTFERNIVYWNNASPLLGMNWKDNNFKLDYNCYYNSAGKVEFPGKLDLAAWQTERKQDEHSVIADPMFEDAAKANFRLKADSPALKLGFQPFDYTWAGRTSAATLTNGLPPVPGTFDGP